MYKTILMTGIFNSIDKDGAITHSKGVNINTKAIINNNFLKPLKCSFLISCLIVSNTNYNTPV